MYYPDVVLNNPVSYVELAPNCNWGAKAELVAYLYFLLEFGIRCVAERWK